MVMDRLVMVCHLCLKLNTIASPLNPPPKGRGRSSRCPCPGIGGLREAGKPVLHRGSGSLLYGEYIYFTKDMRVRSVYGTLSILYVLSYERQDMIKIFGVKVPPCADLLARQAAHCGKTSPSVHRVHLHKMGTM